MRNDHGPTKMPLLYCSLYSIIHFFYRNPSLKLNNGIDDPPYIPFPPPLQFHPLLAIPFTTRSAIPQSTIRKLDTALSNPSFP